MFLLKEKPRTSDVVIERLDDHEDEDQQGIRCPHCRWRPSASDRWTCINFDTPEPPFPSCGTSWNTFDTRGRCPGCGHQWRWTLCLRCQKWSLHDAWYESSGRER